MSNDKLRFFSEKAVARTADELNLTKEEAFKFLKGIEDTPMPIKPPYQVRSRARKVYLSNGAVAFGREVKSYSGTPVFNTMEGHEHDAGWEYPLLSVRMSGVPAGAEVVSQAEWSKIRLNLSKKMLSTMLQPTAPIAPEKG